jgi:LPS sulfotransferase NodH
MARPGFDSWLLCATPRSGSTLLCGLLESSGVAGHPASYFNRRGLHDYATDWRVAQPVGGRIDSVYVQAALAAGRTPNGVFGGRLMAESRPELLADLAAAADEPLRSELELLSDQFGRLRFVHLRRVDAVAQAVSWAKSLQTHFWHPGEPVEPGAEDPHYDEELIKRLVSTIERFEADWNTWFAEQHINPCEVTYEQLAADPLAVAHQVLDFLDLELPSGHRLVVGHRRQADQINAQWIDRFKAR